MYEGEGGGKSGLKGGGRHDVMVIVDSEDNVCRNIMVVLSVLLRATRVPHPDRWIKIIKYSTVNQ